MKQIVIVGGGTSGWLTAAILAKGLKSTGYTISLVDSPDVATIGVGEATIPPIVTLCDYLGVDESNFLSQIDATYKYGIHFENWSKLGESYMHAFGELGTAFHSGDQHISFVELWLRNASALGFSSVNAFSPAAVAAYNGRFNPTPFRSDSINDNLFYPLSNLFYAYQFDAGLLVGFLSSYAKELGVKNIKASVVDVELSSKGEIACLDLSGGEKLSADLFVDCSGIGGALSKQALGLNYVSWRSRLPCDRAIAVQTKHPQGAPILPYTKSIALKCGWQWQIPLRSRLGNGYVYSSEFCSDEEAERELRGALGDAVLITEPKLIRFDAGCLDEPWFKNCIAIGLSAGFTEPLESTSIHLVHKYAIELKNAIKYGESLELEAQRFNRMYVTEMESIREFLSLHYHCTRRDDSEFWKFCQAIDVGETMRARLVEFNERGYISIPDGELFPFQSWFQVLVGQRYLMDYTQFASSDYNKEKEKQFFENVQIAINNEVSKLPRHTDYLIGG